jgi:subtilisin family serine protease
VARVRGRRGTSTGRWPASLLALTFVASALPAAAVATADDAAPPAFAANDRAIASDTLLISGGTREDVDAARAALDGVAEVDEVTARVLLAAGDHAEIRTALDGLTVAVETDAGLHAAWTPNDPEFDRQWGLRNVGQEVQGEPGVEGIDVNATRAWRHTRGARDVTVAVVDTRIPSHPDLDGNLVRGSGDRFVNDNPQCFVEQATHGAEVAGIAAAVADNGRGIAGLAPRVRLMPVPFLDNCGDGSLTGAAHAIAWASENGADVIIASFASMPRPDAPDALKTAIEDAGVPVVAAAGNTVTGLDLSAQDQWGVYPASFAVRNLVSVASVDNQGELSQFSNYGEDDIELAAPGRRIYTTSFSSSGQADYRYQEGTSFAAPFVAAAVALGIGMRPVLTSEAILDLTLETTRPLDDLEGRVATGGMLDAGALVYAIAREGACPTERTDPSGFADVPPGGVHSLGIDCIAAWDITRGRTATTYEPREAVTRGQMASFLATVIDAGPGLPASPSRAFPDVAGSVHERPINALAELGIVRGHGDGTYRPSAPVTRAQMASFLVNTYEHLVGPAPAPDERWFEDTGGSVHAPAADKLWELGITAGISPRTYNPHPDVRRDQMASFVARLLDRVVREGAVERT